MRTVQTIHGDTIDLICQRYFGKTGGVTEQVMALNPHLVSYNAVLPSQLKIILPAAPNRTQKQVIQLWT